MKILPEVDRKWIGLIHIGRWIEVDPSRFNECGGQCQIEVRIFRHVA